MKALLRMLLNSVKPVGVMPGDLPAGLDGSDDPTSIADPESRRHSRKQLTLIKDPAERLSAYYSKIYGQAQPRDVSKWPPLM